MMTEREAVLYQMMGAFYKAGLPLVFKGALVVKAIMSERGFNLLERETHDIDANWVSNPPAMDTLVSAINQVLHDEMSSFKVASIQDYTEMQSACLGVTDTETNVRYATIDIKVKPGTKHAVYCVNDVKFEGVMVNEILADKISVLSGNKIFRRAKDFIDVYALSHCVEIKVSDIIDTCGKEGRTLSPFSEFLNRKTELEHAYNRLQRIRGKPTFEEIYSYMASFLRAFIERSSEDLVWNSRDHAWAKGDRHPKKRAADR
jgi:hypothetical protein